MSQNKSVLEPLYAQYLKERQYLAGFSPRTIKLFRWVFNRWDALIGEMPTKQNLKEWVIKLNESGIKPVTINSYARVFNAFLTWLLEEGHIPERIRVSKVKEGQRPLKVYSEDTLHKLLRFIPRTFAEHRIYTLICVGIDTGCRIDELLTLRREGVDLDNLLITVIGKGDKARIIPISLECRKVLYKFLRLHKFDFIFPTKQGNKLSYRTALDHLKSTAEQLGITGKVGFHMLRHTFATSYLRDGGNLIYLQRILGHSDIAITKIYVANQTEDLALMHRKTSLLSKLR
jgi:integrase/recombinase XerD